MINYLVNYLFELSRPAKRSIQMASDCALIALCFWMSMALRLEGIFTEIELKSWLTLVAVAPATVFAFERLGLYNSVVRYMAERAITTIIVGAGLSSVAMFLTNQFFLLGVPRSVPGIYFPLLVLATGATRLLMRLLYLATKEADRKPVVIYGANEAGRLLMKSLQESRNYRPVCFIDDRKPMHNVNISGVPVLSFERAKEKIAEQASVMALIAMGDSDLALQRQAAKAMASLGLEVRVMPKTSDLVSGRVRISSFKKVRIEELLGRDPVLPDPHLMSVTTTGRSVMVTGAGGSIGSELCRQILKQAPLRLTMVEFSEYALYALMEELSAAVKKYKYNVTLVPLLGSITQNHVIETAIQKNSVDTLFHAAAYKHVPLVEVNAVEALTNNSLGTLITAQAAGRLGVKHFTLVSTDKAVRPTNIMGATKRLAELAISDAAKSYTATKFCSVRFGNVLGSSGSVVPKFEKQIHEGGPITLTHPDITRYFMSIPEAAQLVIQASAMAKRGDVFLLDMGEPIRIIDLARTMCSLNGQKLHTNTTEIAPEGSVKLEVTGLRPGEKLYEELLIAGETTSTQHPKIKRDSSIDIVDFDIQTVIKQLQGLSSNAEVAAALTKLPIEYKMDALHGN